MAAQARAIIQAFKAQKRPPYECPLCHKVYKSFSGAEYHVTRTQHNEDGSVPPKSTPSRGGATSTPRSQKQKRKRRGFGNASGQGTTPARPPVSPSTKTPIARKEPLSYADSLRFVQFELFDVDAVVEKWPIDDAIDATIENGKTTSGKEKEEEAKEEETQNGDGERSESATTREAPTKDEETEAPEIESSDDRVAPIESNGIENDATKLETRSNENENESIVAAAATAASPLVVVDDEDDGAGSKVVIAPETPRRTPKVRRRIAKPPPPPTPCAPALPTPSVRPIEPTRGGGGEEIATNDDYRLYVEKPIEELEAEVEYDMDEEDCAWLGMTNRERAAADDDGDDDDGDDDERQVDPVPETVFEYLMDRFEKESFFDSNRHGNSATATAATSVSMAMGGTDPDENAVCSICNDGECQNSNAILFCDMCNLAVHQDCYGVPYIPEGQWLCRRCLHSPSRPVDCALCPNKGGAFKQTDNGRWAHVVCALWIPECGFANPVFLEPIDGVQEIPAARWRLNCCICRRRQGACIQCVRNNCYTAFHPTCAQQAGLYLKIEPAVDETTGEATVRKVALCDLHTMKGSDEDVGGGDATTDGPDKRAAIAEKIRAKAQETFKKSRKIMEERGRQVTPILSVPHVPARRLGEIIRRLPPTPKKIHFTNSLYNYWMLKRQSRSGVPLIRRLQASQQEKQPAVQKDLNDEEEIKESNEQWKLLRQDLDKSRLLLALIKKREKLKRDIMNLRKTTIELRVEPLVHVLRTVVKQLKDNDTGRVFAKPVSLHVVKDYLEVIDHPMDLQSIIWKVENRRYACLDDFVEDFDTMINNAFTYNEKDTYYFRMGVKMRETGARAIIAARNALIQSGQEEANPRYLVEIDDSIPPTAARPDLVASEQLEDLNEKLQAAESIRHEGARLQRLKQLKKEHLVLKLKITKEKSTPVKMSEVATTPKLKSKTDSALVPVNAPLSPPLETINSTPSSTSSLAGAIRKRRSSARGGGSGGGGGGSGSGNESKKLELNFIDTGIRLWRKKQKLLETDETDEPLPAEEAMSRRRDSVAATVNGDDDDDDDDGSDDGSDEANGEGEDRKNDEVINCAVEKSRRGRPRKHSIDERRASAKRQRRGRIGRPPKVRTRRTSTESVVSTESSRIGGEILDDLEEDDGKEDFGGVSNGHHAAADDDEDGERIQIDENDDEAEDEDDDGGDNSLICSRRRMPATVISTSSLESLNEDDGEVDVLLQPLHLVWAKCRGYPTYPAMIIDPQAPEAGFKINGVTIPGPPPEVLDLKHREKDYLILFFDPRRTWQWLPRSKLDLLGVDPSLDQTKLLESKKTSWKKSVSSAYCRALAHQKKVNGEMCGTSARKEELGGKAEYNT